LYKINNVQYGEAEIALWQENAVDLIGPWKVKYPGQELIFNALMCINTVTNWVKLIQINNCPAAHVAQKFEDEWLSCYPRPDKCIHDP